ncbi:MAG: arginine--tRNA ligase, partial [Gemmataceae bacterium]
AENGDYQANFAMKLKPVLNQPPAAIAADVVARLPVGGTNLFSSASVAGPGFINLKLNDLWLAERMRDLAADPRLGIARTANPKTIVIDLSGPNVAKPLHVGHLRSTIIGDALVRILRHAGHTVIGDNHLGDWGTQFGILLYGYKNHRDDAAYTADPVRELARLYVLVRNLAKVTTDDEEAAPPNPVLEACRQETAKLHAGDPENVKLWEQFMPACIEMLRPIYERLDVRIDHALGESFYNPMLPAVVADLLAKGIAVESAGAVVVPNAKGIVPTPEQMKSEEPPALVRKRDGAFTYTTTDLATIRYRAETWKPHTMLYVVDARQALHFRTLFANARRWGYDQTEFEHTQFGSILGLDGKPLRTRDGGVPELGTLLDEAVALGRAKYEASHAERVAQGHDLPPLTPTAVAEIAEVIGIGAVKYADLSMNRTSDYKYDADKMLATEGNTATYMQYAYARARSILRKADVNIDALRAAPPLIVLSEPPERQLVLQLLRLSEAFEAAVREYLPHYLTQSLWDVAKAASTFIESCPVIKASTDELRQSRLVLVDCVARTIQQTLNLLGIRTVEQM